MVRHIIVKIETHPDETNPEKFWVKAEASDAELVDQTPHGSRKLFQIAPAKGGAVRVLSAQQISLSNVDVVAVEEKDVAMTALDNCLDVISELKQIDIRRFRPELHMKPNIVPEFEPGKLPKPNWYDDKG